MSGGPTLGPARRGPGRPKGSKNRRAADLKGYVEARFGGSAALQMAAACMVTPAEVKLAGSVLLARVAKARDLKEALGCSLKEAWDLLSKELAALAPYTDQRQPLAIETSGSGFVPAVIFAHAAPPSDAAAFENTGDFQIIEGEVSRPKSHDEGQATDFLELPLLPAPDA